MLDVESFLVPNISQMVRGFTFRIFTIYTNVSTKISISGSIFLKMRMFYYMQHIFTVL